MIPIFYHDIVTPSGHPGDEVISALQKFIRRGETELAVRAAYELYLTGEELTAYLWRRLLVISAEDVGLGEPMAPVVVDALHRSSRELSRDSSDYQLLFVHAVRYLCARISSRMSFLSSKSVKKTLRRSIYEKLMRLGVSYQEKASSSEIVQVAVEGVDQLETYFGSYLPQFFYSLLAPVTLFVALAFVNLPAAVILLICVPLIPGAIMGVQKFAKKLLAGYWGQYTAMGDSFLENLQGLTTLKIYQADEWKNSEMNREAEKFRKITMKVLTMQLNSITIMDLVAYGGAALGIIIGVWQMQAGNVGFDGCLAIILLSAEFFIPMRLLGSFFHIAMNGMAAAGSGRRRTRRKILPGNRQDDPLSGSSFFL